ncbi:MAG: lanthionine synthetase LanC family protein [Pseudonocardiaceae bacterium]
MDIDAAAAATPAEVSRYRTHRQVAIRKRHAQVIVRTALCDVEGPTLCHGHAGVPQSAATSQATTADLAAAAVTEAFNPRLPFAFQHRGNGSATDEPGLLTGSAGVALALADHGQLPATPVPARWDSILLLS